MDRQPGPHFDFSENSAIMCYVHLLGLLTKREAVMKVCRSVCVAVLPVCDCDRLLK